MFRTEARYYDIPSLVLAIQRQMRLRGRSVPLPVNHSTTESAMMMTQKCECVAVHISPDLGKYQIMAKNRYLMVNSQNIGNRTFLT
jgi:DTW domain-containing protein YfiP